jgi:hypothetical protein
MFRLLGRDQDGIQSRAKSAESYLELPFAMAAVILSRRCRRSWIFSLYTMFLTYPNKKRIHQGKIWASGRPEDWSVPSNPGVGELLIQGFVYRLAKMRCYPPSTEHIQNLHSFAEF